VADRVGGRCMPFDIGVLLRKRDGARRVLARRDAAPGKAGQPRRRYREPLDGDSRATVGRDPVRQQFHQYRRIDLGDRPAACLFRPGRRHLWRGSPDNVIGVLNAKELWRALHAAAGDAAKIDIPGLAKPPWFVPDTTPVAEQLKAFRHRKTPFALVVDEYGELEGLVTLEDIIEEIVGDISDEHDIAVPGVRPLPDGSVNVDGGVPIRDVNRAMDWNIPDDEATTIAGIVIHEARSIPEPGQSFTFHGFRFQVLRRTRNRITALRVAPLMRKPTAKAS